MGEFHMVLGYFEIYCAHQSTVKTVFEGIFDLNYEKTPIHQKLRQGQNENCPRSVAGKRVEI